MKITPFLKRQNSVFLTTLIGLILIGILICLPMRMPLFIRVQNGR